MNKISENLKKIRSVKKLSQLDLAEILEIGRHNIGAYEEGRATPKTETLIKIANIFSIELEKVLTKNLTVNDILGFDLDDANPSETKKNSNQVLVNITDIDMVIRKITEMEKELKDLKKTLRKLK
jgi:transcriptional regulator with XRE-family HTH domain